MDRNGSLVSVFVALVVGVVALGGLKGCEDSRDHDTKRMSVCTEAGGQWVPARSGYQCVNPVKD